MYVLTDFAPNYKKGFFLEKSFYKQVKYLLIENPLAMQIEKKDFKKIVYAPALGDFVVSKFKGKFSFFEKPNYAYILAKEISEEISDLFNLLNGS